jgi:hypothetical protein
MTRNQPVVVSRTCAREGCGKTFEVTLTQARSSAQRFCSRPCNRTVGNIERGERKRKEWDEDPRSHCPCGVGRIPYEVRNTTKYCSPDCRETYGLKRQPDPANHRTFQCQNCGETVSRPKSFGYAKYCSNACAQKHTKKKKHIVVDEAVVLDSTWEALFWGLCGLHKIPVERYEREHGVLWRAAGWYAPDFLLTDMGIAVEVKGLEDPEDAIKWRKFREVRQLAVLGRAELTQACKSDDLATYLIALASVQPS